MDDVTEEEMVAAAQAANAHDFISNFPEGYDTLVGERGIRLSGGQKQRIAIARTLLCNPRIMLLDEATSALDANSEHVVQEALDRIMKNRTVLIVAHRLSTVVDADVIMVMSKEGIIDSGKHDDLLARCGEYKELVQRQMQVAKEDAPLPDVVEEIDLIEAAVVLPNDESTVTANTKGTPKTGNARQLDMLALENILMMNNTDATAKKEKEDAGGKTVVKPKPTGVFAWQLLRAEFPVLVLTMFLTLGFTALDLYIPIINRSVINHTIGNEDSATKRAGIVRGIQILVVIYSVNSTWVYIRVCIFGTAGARAVARLRQITLRAIFSQDMGFFDTQTSGALASRLTSDVQVIQHAIMSGIIETVLGFLRMTVGLVMSTFVCWQLALLTLAMFPVAAVVVGPLVPVVIKLGVKQGDALARSVNLSTEATGSMKTVISFGSETFFEMLYKSAVGDIDGSVNCCWWPRKSSHSTYRYGVPKAVILSSGSPLVMSLFVAMTTLVSWFGYDLILKEELTFGDLIAFMMYAFNIVLGAAGMAGSAAGVFAARSALQMIYEIVTRESAMKNTGGEEPADLSADVSLKTSNSHIHRGQT